MYLLLMPNEGSGVGKRTATLLDAALVRLELEAMERNVSVLYICDGQRARLTEQPIYGSPSYSSVEYYMYSRQMCISVSFYACLSSCPSR